MKFTTNRLLIDEYPGRYLNESEFKKLTREIMAILTPEVTAALPGGWNNIDSTEKAKKWIENRAAEGDVLTVSYNENNNLIGFIFLYDVGEKGQKSVYRFGYLLAESEWGKGLGTELIKGLLAKCKSSGKVKSLSGGVERNNLASIRVLEKIGFSISQSEKPEDTIFYEYSF